MARQYEINNKEELKEILSNLNEGVNFKIVYNHIFINSKNKLINSIFIDEYIKLENDLIKVKKTYDTEYSLYYLELILFIKQNKNIKLIIMEE